MRHDSGLIPAVLAISFAHGRRSSTLTGKPGSCRCSKLARRMVSSSSALARCSRHDRSPMMNDISALAASALASADWSIGDPRMNLTCCLPSGEPRIRLSPFPGASSDIRTTSGNMVDGLEGCSNSSRKICSVADPLVTAPPSTRMCELRNRERLYCPVPVSMESFSAMIAETSDDAISTPLTIMIMA